MNVKRARKTTPQAARMADVLNAIREQYDMVDGEIAQALEVDPSTLVHWRSGRTQIPSKRQRLALEHVFGVNLAYLTRGEGQILGPAAERASAKQTSTAGRLVDLRDRLNLTQAALARQTGITRTSYILFEQGRRMPTTEHLLILARKYGVSLDWLLLGEGEMFLAGSSGGGALERELAGAKAEQNAIKKELQRLSDALRSLTDGRETPSAEETSLLEALRSLPAEARHAYRSAILAQAQPAKAAEPGASESSGTR